MSKYQQVTLAMMKIISSKAVEEFFREIIENATKQTVIMGVDMIDFSVSIEKEFVDRGWLRAVLIEGINWIFSTDFIWGKKLWTFEESILRTHSEDDHLCHSDLAVKQRPVHIRMIQIEKMKFWIIRYKIKKTTFYVYIRCNGNVQLIQKIVTTRAQLSKHEASNNILYYFQKIYNLRNLCVWIIVDTYS